MRALNGIPPEVFANEGLVECFIDILRTDLRLGETYRCDPVVRLRHPITAFGGVHDGSCSREDLEAWQEHTEARCVVRWLPGDHFFIREYEHLVAAALAALPSVDPDPIANVAAV